MIKNRPRFITLNIQTQAWDSHITCSAHLFRISVNRRNETMLIYTLTLALDMKYLASDINEYQLILLIDV